MSNFPFDNCAKSKADFEIIIRQVTDYMVNMEYRGFNLTGLFRGQGRDCWKLIPKIARQYKKIELIEKTEYEIVNDFYNCMIDEDLMDAINNGLKRVKYEKDWLLIQQAQHYELPTRFLDWSGAWKTALCFAVADEWDDNCPGHFWICLVPDKFWIGAGNSAYLEEDPFKYEKTIFLNSSMPHSGNPLIQIAQRRKGTQNGRFCVQPYSKVIFPLEEQDEYRPFLHKIVIPADSKKQIREELASEGITKEALFVSEPFDPSVAVRYKEIAEKVKVIIEKLSVKYAIAVS